jgi:hypothetical protein
MHSAIVAYFVDINAFILCDLEQLRVPVLGELEIRVITHNCDAIVATKLNHILVAAKGRVTHLGHRVTRIY